MVLFDDAGFTQHLGSQGIKRELEESIAIWLWKWRASSRANMNQESTFCSPGCSDCYTCGIVSFMPYGHACWWSSHLQAHFQSTVMNLTLIGHPKRRHGCLHRKTSNYCFESELESDTCYVDRDLSWFGLHTDCKRASYFNIFQG